MAEMDNIGFDEAHMAGHFTEERLCPIEICPGAALAEGMSRDDAVEPTDGGEEQC